MDGYKGHFERLRRALAASVVALLAAAPTLAAETAQSAASGFVPTMADYLGVYDALQRYRFGLDKHDQAMEDSAFWEARKPPTPPPGFALPSGPGGTTPSASSSEAVEIWHLPLDSYIHFESATRATHYEYFLSIYPQPEKKAEGISNMQARTSIVGWPGHYEDILEKRNGEWRILQRKTRINEK
jgi:hypothetical protein